MPLVCMTLGMFGGDDVPLVPLTIMFDEHSKNASTRDYAMTHPDGVLSPTSQSGFWQGSACASLAFGDYKL